MAIILGLMSGTSCDGVDAVAARFKQGNSIPEILASRYKPYPTELRLQTQALFSSGEDELHRAADLANRLAMVHAELANQMLAEIKGESTAAIGCHGQTIRHRPDADHPYSIQLNNGALIAQHTGIPTVTDFRSADMAIGGQGAPFAPIFHQQFIADKRLTRAVVNIGGITNLSILQPGKSPRGYDLGPGNTLLDLLAQDILDTAYDRNGDLARTGKVDEDILKAMLADEYFTMPPPKSTGQDWFNQQWLDHYYGTAKPKADNVADRFATLTELTASIIMNAINQDVSSIDEIYLCGGGVHNHFLQQRVSALLPGHLVASTDVLGVDPDYIEALGFAWLAYCNITNQQCDLRSVTGAKRTAILGALYKSNHQP